MSEKIESDILGCSNNEPHDSHTWFQYVDGRKRAKVCLGCEGVEPYIEPEPVVVNENTLPEPSGGDLTASEPSEVQEYYPEDEPGSETRLLLREGNPGGPPSLENKEKFEIRIVWDRRSDDDLRVDVHREKWIPHEKVVAAITIANQIIMNEMLGVRY